MRNLRIIALLTGALLGGCDDKGGDSGDTTGEEGGTGSRTDAILALSGDSAAGEAVFTANCTSCHPADGSEGFGPALSEEVPEHSDEDILDQVINGEGSMPPFGDALTDQQMADLLAYLRATFGG